MNNVKQKILALLYSLFILNSVKPCLKKNAYFFATLLRWTVFQILKDEGPLKFEKNKER